MVADALLDRVALRVCRAVTRSLSAGRIPSGRWVRYCSAIPVGAVGVRRSVVLGGLDFDTHIYADDSGTIVSAHILARNGDEFRSGLIHVRADLDVRSLVGGL